MWILFVYISHCGTPNPTWKEIRHFVWFLNHQLSACEQSNVIRTVKGLKEFTVKFMIDMSRVNNILLICMLHLITGFCHIINA